MSITHRRVSDENASLGFHPRCEAFWAQLFQDLARSVCRCYLEPRNTRIRCISGRFGTTTRIRMAIDGHVRDPGQKFRCAILARLEIEQCGCLVEEPGRIVVRAELRVNDDIVQESEIGRDATNAV